MSRREEGIPSEYPPLSFPFLPPSSQGREALSEGMGNGKKEQHHCSALNTSCLPSPCHFLFEVFDFWTSVPASFMDEI